METLLITRRINFKLKLLPLLIFIGIAIQACGQKSGNQKGNEQQKKLKLMMDSIAQSKKNDSIRFEKYLNEMQGIWVFQQTQSCANESNDRFGLNGTNGGTGVCRKMKIVITGNTYKAYIMDFATKNNVVVDDKELGTGNPFCEGKIELRSAGNIAVPTDAKDRAVVICSYFSAVCTEFGGNNTGASNRFYWDELKGALYWNSDSGKTDCVFSGYCQHL